MTVSDGYDGGGGGGGLGHLSAPPVSGLGNFKGVMLCNRPSDEPASKLHGGGDGPPPFKSMVSASHGEQLGLAPCKSVEPSARGVKKRGPSAALRQHVRWLRELQDQMRGERNQAETDDKMSEEKKRRMRATMEKQREAVQRMIQDRQIAATQGKPPPASTVSKPLWAMTAKEKDDFEEEEGDALIGFAEGLDFDKYIGDLEFRHALGALKDRAGRLQREQDAFKDALVKEFNTKADEDDASTCAGESLRLEDGIDGQSLLGDQKSEYSTCSRRPRNEDRQSNGMPDWDSSTACGDDRPRADRSVKDAASVVMEAAPHLRAIHSKESVQRIIEKTRDKTQMLQNNGVTPEELIECMRRDGAVPVPVITASEDTQQRQHKPVDPSLLPYLYRSPAV